MNSEIVNDLVGLKTQLKEISNKVSKSSKSIEEAQIRLKPFCSLEIEIEKTIKKIKQ
ncbi:hypothetical protein K5I29_04120 [Flavobacterium agricola]|uniref:Uncharacterized protein n=1 Tax=Flavobacterium agricola TaxID=2870839 RepID=A0ABY6M3L6_9FLAO|nr:hypothetical protein [Flavobacterium agricola]UYW02095.1 hypothetical protein K5I29_04120 [Flavobacterium agricola]